MSTFAGFFIKQIEDDLSWREAELAILRKEVINSTPGTPKHITFLRTNLAMIYAHYEGFCKFAIGIYIDAIEKRKSKRADLKWKIASTSLFEFVNELKNEKEGTDFLKKFLGEFDAALEQNATFERPDNIANLWPNLLIYWLDRLDLNHNNVQQNSKQLDSLVNNRNQIAHGKKLTISTLPQLDEYANAAKLAMHEVAIGIADALEKQLYLRRSRVMTVLGHATDR